MRAYKNIKISETTNIKQNSDVVVVTYRKLKLISSLFCLFLIFNIMGISLQGLGISNEIRRLTSSWTPNLTDIGKLKFVNSDNEFDEMVVSEIEEFAMPFENVFVTEVSAGEFNVSGLGGMVVKCCFDGKVEKIENENGKRKVTISHKRGLKSVYEGLDNIGVKEGDTVKKNSAIGISETSQITFKIYFRNKLITGLTFKDGDMIFI